MKVKSEDILKPGAVLKVERKYEEAAKARYPRWFQDFEEGIKMSAFLAGAYFAEKELNYKEQQIERLAEIERVEKQAHNAAIDKALAILQKHNEFHFMDGTIDILNGELEKLKL